MSLRETSRRWLIWLCIVTAVFAARIGWVLYDRSQSARSKPSAPKLTERDYLTVIPKFGVGDLASAKKLAGSSLWVKAGYAIEYSRYSTSATTARPSPGMKLEPMEEITVRDFVKRPLPQKKQWEILLLFEKGGEEFSAVIGYFEPEAKQYQIQLDDLFYAKNPRHIYDHWDEETWQKIRHHQLEKQMTFAQVNLSLGAGTLVTTEAGGTQLYQFDRKPGGEPGKTRVRFVDGRVKEFEIRN
jgi:hypothetical protein